MAIRIYNPEKWEETYEAAYEVLREIEMLNGEREVKWKNEFFEQESQKVEQELKENEAKGSVKKLYATAGGVISKVEDVESSLVVFLQCPFLSQHKEKRLIIEVRRKLAKKYDIKNKLKVILYENREDLRTKMHEQGEEILGSHEDARAVVYCVKGSGIHPGQDKKQDMFSHIKTAQDESKLYYVEESYEGFEEGKVPDPIIGPRIALAIGIKEFMAENRSPEFLHELNRLLTEISGGAISTKESTADIVSVLERLLVDGEALRIKKIDFETLQEQIEAEEMALKAL